ncbi:MAG: methylthioribulose 1-phosphate dehydratase [Acidobacteria bacterium]|nr:MAG: methylthioribulose 1-phosphate dehydratase [Acidobacteriota bacterium]
MQPGVPTIARQFGEIGRDFYARGWTLGTSGNFSTLVSRKPLTLAITASAVSKGAIAVNDVVLIGPNASVIGPRGQRRKQSARPSAEALLHVTVARVRHAGAVLHTHSIWGTILSDVHAGEGGLTIAGYEMLKGLEGVTTHEHAEWLPILENDQNMERLARQVEETLERFPTVHAFLLRQHGLYTWGDGLAQARRHVEILEFLFEASGRLRTIAETHAGGSHGTDKNPRTTANVGGPRIHHEFS